MLISLSLARDYNASVKELLRIADDSAWVPAGNRKNIALYRIEEASNPNLLCQKACGRVPGTTKRIKDILVDSVRVCDSICARGEGESRYSSAVPPIECSRDNRSSIRCASSRKRSSISMAIR